MSRLWSILTFLSRTGLPFVLLGLHLAVFASFARRWDRVAAVTILPVWAWAGAATLLCLISWLMHRGKGALAVGLLWLATGVFLSEEPRFLLRVGKETPKPGPPAAHAGQKVIRVACLNCRRMNPAAAEEVLPWQPDIVMLQEAPNPSALAALTKRLYPAGGNHAGAYDCSILTRGRISLLQVQATPGLPVNYFTTLPAVVELDGRKIHLVCVHLQGAVTDLSLHRPSTWQRHYYNRQSRRAEIYQVRNRLAVNLVLSEGPVILAGDFNAPAEDAVMQELRTDFTDAMQSAGSGLANTYPNHFPVHRIDHIFSNGKCQPVRAVTVKTVNSDHRMIIADFVLP